MSEKLRRSAVFLGFLAVLTVPTMLTRLDVVDARRQNPWSTINVSPLSVQMAARDSAWVCGFAPLNFSEQTQGRLRITNLGSSAASVSISPILSTKDLAPEVMKIQLDAGMSQVVDYSSLVGATEKTDVIYAAPEIRADSGAVVAQYLMGMVANENWQPCSTEAGTHAYLPWGSTAKDSALLVGLVNPFDEIATLDLKFRTDAGVQAPPDFSGIVVEPRQLVMLNIGDHVRRRDLVSTEVSVRTGRVVVSQIQDRESKTFNYSMAIGRTATISNFPAVWIDSVSSPSPNDSTRISTSAQLFVQNPSAKESAYIEVRALVEGASVSPFIAEVGPGQTRLIQLSGDLRLPTNLPVSLLLTSSGAKVASQLLVDAPPATTSPGTQLLKGTDSTSKDWLLSPVSAEDEVVISNPNDSDVEVVFDGVVEKFSIPAGEAKSIVVPAGRERAILRVTSKENVHVSMIKKSKPQSSVFNGFFSS